MANQVTKLLLSITIIFFAGLPRLSIAADLEALDKNYRSRNSFQYFEDLEKSIKTLLQNEPNSSELYWRLARTQFYMGNRSGFENAQKRFYFTCQENAERALAISSNSAEGSYFNAICAGKVSQMDGIWSSFTFILNFKEQMERAVQLDPNLEFGGPHRALGKFFHEVPFILGGDLNQSIEHLKLAVQFGPEYSDNYYYLSESLMEAGDYQTAKSVLLAYLEKSEDETDASKKRERAKDFLQQIETINLH
jgi:tetratricopeptide (TPR) repeat protein